MESKAKTFNVRNFIKTEPRLLSLSMPRDLSLGGTKLKKVYKPNVNVVRNKNKTKEIINKVQLQKRPQRTFHNNRNNQSRFIQSTGVFSQGTNEIKRPKIHSDRFLNNTDREGTSMVIPKVFKNAWKIDVKEEASIINELLGFDDEEVSDEGEYGPIILPLRNNKDKIKIKIEDEIKIKEEADTKSKFNGYNVKTKEINMENDLNYQLPTFLENKLYDDDHPCISLIKIPDSLPGKGFAEDSDKVIDYNLQHMIEGKIGKILIRKSGKVEMSIGQTEYILDSVDSSPFKEELMYIPENLKTSFGPDITSLGNIDETYILSPCWKSLFDQKALKKKKPKSFSQ